MAGSHGESTARPPAAPPPTATQHVMTARDVSRASGLREDLVARFVPAIDTPRGSGFGARQLAIATVVKQLTDIGAPASTVVAAVQDLNTCPDEELSPVAAKSGGRSSRRRARIAFIATATVSLVIGGLIGGLAGRVDRSGNGGPATTPAPVTVSASPQTLQPAVPASVDPVCAEWGTTNDKYRAQRVDWAKTDSSLSAGQWSPEQRSVTLGIIPGLRSEANESRELAAKATVPMLRELMQQRAAYEELFADLLPNYNPNADKNLWIAVTDFGNSINSLCSAVVPPK
jgi:hypothetical protein